MWIVEHEVMARATFGKPFTEVHLWLDEFAGWPQCGMKHRKYRHHLAGIEEARMRFGNIGAEVARQHIIADLLMDQWTENDPFPRDEKHYVEMGLF